MQTAQPLSQAQRVRLRLPIPQSHPPHHAHPPTRPYTGAKEKGGDAAHTTAHRAAPASLPFLVGAGRRSPIFYLLPPPPPPPPSHQNLSLPPRPPRAPGPPRVRRHRSEPPGPRPNARGPARVRQGAQRRARPRPHHRSVSVSLCLCALPNPPTHPPTHPPTLLPGIYSSWQDYETRQDHYKPPAAHLEQFKRQLHEALALSPTHINAHTVRAHPPTHPPTYPPTHLQKPGL